MLVSDEKVQEALDFLADDADRAAKHRAERIYVEEFRKTMKAKVMKEHASLPIGAQEREAYADPRYIAHLDALRQAVFEDSRMTFKRIAAEAVIEAWRSQSANYRAMKI